jgi:hypothetical protein
VPVVIHGGNGLSEQDFEKFYKWLRPILIYSGFSLKYTIKKIILRRKKK